MNTKPTTARATADTAATNVYAKQLAWEAARADVDAFGPAPLLGTWAEMVAHFAAVAPAGAVEKAAMTEWRAASQAWHVAVREALSEDADYLPPARI